jgi:acyl dehydratase
MGIGFEDFVLGEKFTTPGRSIFNADIVNFVGLTGMYEDLFCNLEYIEKASAFKKRIVPGALTLAISVGLFNRTGWFDTTGLALMGFRKVNFINPLVPGDTIRNECEVIGKQETKQGNAGILTLQVMVKNQRDEDIVSYQILGLIAKQG